MKIIKYSDINERTSKPKYTKEELKKLRGKAKPINKEEEKIKKIDENTEQDIKIKNYFEFIYGLPLAKQTEYVEFFKSLDLTDEQYIKLSNIISDYGSDQFDEGRSFGPIGSDY